MKNLLIIKILNNIADILELQNIQFKPKAYRNAAQSIEELTEDIVEIYERKELTKIQGVGNSIAKKIEEIIETGKLRYYEKLKKKIKVNVEELNKIPGLGPKKILLLYKKLKVKNLKELEKVAKQKKITKLEGFGEETQDQILKSIAIAKSHPKKIIYTHLTPIVEEIKNYFTKFKFVENVEVAGSYRRGLETSKDLDILVISAQPTKVIRAFVNLPDIKKVLVKGTTKSSIKLNNNLQVDLRVFNKKSYGSALIYFTGNKQHNIEIRKIALSKNYRLNEYGLFKNKRRIAGKKEKEIYNKLNLQYIPPELRENRGEILVARKKKLPKLVNLSDVKGIFHNHTKWSDGSNTLLEMAQEAEKLKFKFISFNDHYGNVRIAQPINETKLNAYLKAVDKVQKKVNIKVFSGIEIDILKNGKLPLTKNKLKKLDIIIAAVHLATKMKETEMTKRICSVLENYPVNILAHPTNRLLNKREPLEINLNKIFSIAKENNVFLEINASPIRRDLSGTNIKAALDLGCKFSLGTDAHDLEHLKKINLSVINAKRGWTTKKDILNCWNLNKIEKKLIIS